MKNLLIAITALSALSVPAHTEHFFRPAPYGEGKIYILADAPNRPKRPSANYVRLHAARVIHVGDDWPDIVHFWDYLRWGSAKNDPKIKQRAGAVRIVIDLYRRVQPPPPAKPVFETLYCTERFIYSDEGDYLELKPPVSAHLNTFLKTQTRLRVPERAIPSWSPSDSFAGTGIRLRPLDFRPTSPHSRDSPSYRYRSCKWQPLLQSCRCDWLDTPATQFTRLSSGLSASHRAGHRS